MARRENITQKIVKNLTEEGERIIKAAYNRKNWENRTYNLHDSYGSAVYVNGNLQRGSIRYVGNPKANPDKNDKELGDWSGARTRTQKGSSHAQFGKTGDSRYQKGDTILAYGRDEINKFFNNYKPINKNGIELVVAVVMFYAKILESGKYQVISSAVTDLSRIANQIGKDVEIYALEINRKADEIASGAFNVTLGQKIR